MDNTDDDLVECEEFTITREQQTEAQRDYWRQVAESDGFDVEHIRVKFCARITGLNYFDCQGSHSFNPMIVLVKRYGMLGLHRYNMLEGTNLQFVSLTKFNVTMNFVRSYYITLLAYDPNPTSLMHRAFQVRADEQSLGKLDLKISIARPKYQENVTTKKPFTFHYHGGALDKREFPDWPSDDDFNDGKRFYKLKQLEWETTDWISLYLDLVICGTDKSIDREFELNNVQILKVVIESTEVVEPPSDRLKAKSLNVYITFKGVETVPRIDEVGEDVERKAIVRRLCDGELYIMGKIWTDKKTSSGGEAESSRKKRKKT